MEAIGEEFLQAPRRPRWETSEPLAYTATARQALRFASERLWAAGHRTLLFPEYYCDSMLSPFLSRAWQFASLRVDGRLMIDGDYLAHVAAKSDSPPVALVALYFGREHDSTIQAAISAIQAGGGVVIDDETHRVIDTRPSNALIRIASLRKLLPVADGAYLIGAIAASLTTSSTDPNAAARWAAMDLKRAAIDGLGDLQPARDLFRSSNAGLETSLEPLSISRRSLETIRRLDYGALAEARRINASTLEGELSDEPRVQILNPSDLAPIASHLVVRVPDVERTRAALASRRIYCPIHWVRHRNPLAKPDWPEDVLSLPLDHRYTTAQMVAVAEHIKDVVRT